MTISTLSHSPDVSGRRKRLVELCESLPGTRAEAAGIQHLAFKVDKKTFGYYLYDHHGDGRIALVCKAPPGEQQRLVADDPQAFFVPPYVGHKGWVGLRLDGARIAWRRVENLVRAAHFLSARRSTRKPPDVA